MTVLDPTTPLGKVRMRIGDWTDLVILPDAVIDSALTDCQNSIPRASKLCAQYILATLTKKTHKKLATIENWSGEQFNNYVEFIRMVILNPNLDATCPIPYAGTIKNPLQTLQDDWQAGYLPGAYVLPYPPVISAQPVIILHEPT